jgi:hypothetical protein
MRALGKRTRLWGGLKDGFGGGNLEIPFEDLKERMLFIESIETVKCLDEGVIESVADAGIGSILGIGFPGWTGGVLQYINGYEGGPAGFVARARARGALRRALRATGVAGGRRQSAASHTATSSRRWPPLSSAQRCAAVPRWGCRACSRGSKRACPG